MTQPWKIQRGDSPLVATALHNGNAIREELLPYLALSRLDRLREEDPHTGAWTAIAPTRVVLEQSRFEVDMNRPRDKAVYLDPESAWGLQVWKGELPEAMVQRSLASYDRLYSELEALYQGLIAEHGRIVVLDLHSYNHLREGPDGPPADPLANPQVNLGTGTLLERGPWEALIQRFIDELSSHDFPWGKLDVRQNVKFFGGNCARWVHERFPGEACVLSVEFKKFFMNEWTGEVDSSLMQSIEQALRQAVPGVLEELERLKSSR